MKILILGDIYGKAGMDAVATYLPFMKDQMNPDLVIANAENASIGGKSLIRKDYDYLKASGIDYFTMGNHTFANDGILAIIDDTGDIVRPANLKEDLPGVGHRVFEKNGKKILLMNLLGETFIRKPKQTNLFAKADEILDSEEYDLAIIDLHAEATSEKIVFANYISDKAGIVFGTHTHIQTSDERILNGTTAYITDVGMCGVFDSAIGVEFKEVEDRMRKIDSDEPFKEATGPVRINAILVTLYDNSLKPYSIERIVVNP